MKRYLLGLAAALGLGLGAASAIYAQTMTQEPTASPSPTMTQQQRQQTDDGMIPGDQDVMEAEEDTGLTGAPDTGMGGLAQ